MHRNPKSAQGLDVDRADEPAADDRCADVAGSFQGLILLVLDPAITTSAKVASA